MILEKTENLYISAIMLYNIQVSYTYFKKTKPSNLSAYFHYWNANYALTTYLTAFIASV